MTMYSSVEILRTLFLETAGMHPEFTGVIETGSGSKRTYYRLSNGDISLVGVSGDNTAENEAFYYLTGHFQSFGLPVPAIKAISLDRKYYLIQDLGDTTLYNVLVSSDEKQKEKFLKKALEHLVRFQVTAMSGLDFGRCYPRMDFDLQAGKWDMNYFKYMFLKPLFSDINEDLLEKEFDMILNDLFNSYFSGFMYRDFQSRNIMVAHNGLWFIDYQGGRLGPIEYDPASLLYQTRISVPPDLRKRLVQYYCNLLNEYRPVDAGMVGARIHSFALLRLLQTLGAYGYRGLFEKKEAFVKPIYPAIKNTLEVIKTMPRRHKPEYIETLLHEALPVFNRQNHENQTLTVNVNSFSYMHGIPDDEAGNGGGFVFDCRALPNPHHELHLREYSGVDMVIADWLGSKPEVSEFLDNCESLVKNTVDVYVQRGFTNLQVNFGCTGGKHRSVYCAEVLCARLKQHYGNIVVKTYHTRLNSN